MNKIPERERGGKNLRGSCFPSPTVIKTDYVPVVYTSELGSSTFCSDAT